MGMIGYKISKHFEPIKKEKLSATDYLAMVKGSEESNIEHVHFESPKLGSGSFGHFIVEYKNPKLVSNV